MEKVNEFPNTIIAITPNTSLRVLVVGDPALLKLMNGDLFDDNCDGSELGSFPVKPGVYSATVEYWFEQGYFEGYKADGESEWDFVLRDVVDITPQNKLIKAGEL